MTIDFSFDKIAAVYDVQRAHPAEVASQIGAAVADLVGTAAPALELGVGTGRIAIPAARAGAQIVGLDVSREMLRVASERAVTASTSFERILGDAQALPFAERSFGAVLAVHVLHLLPDWRRAIDEIVRVLVPGGLLVQGSDWRDPDSCVGLLRGRLRMAVMELQPGSRPPAAGAAVAQALARLGGTTEAPQPLARWSRLVSPAELIAGMAARLDAETWSLPDELLAAAIARVRAWAEQMWSDLDTPQEVEHRFVVTTTRIP